MGRRREDEPWRIGLPEPLALQVEALLLRVLRLAWAVQRAAFPVVTEEQGVRTYRVDQSDAPPISIAVAQHTPSSCNPLPACSPSLLHRFGIRV